MVDFLDNERDAAGLISLEGRVGAGRGGRVSILPGQQFNSPRGATHFDPDRWGWVFATPSPDTTWTSQKMIEIIGRQDDSLQLYGHAARNFGGSPVTLFLQSDPNAPSALMGVDPEGGRLLNGSAAIFSSERTM